MKNLRFGFILILFTLLLGTFVVAGWFFFFSEKPPRVTRPVKLQEVADNLYVFLKKEFPISEEIVNGNTILSCDAANNCEYSEPAKFPTNSWALLPYAAMYGIEAKANGLNEGRANPSEAERSLANEGTRTALSEELKDTLRILHDKLIGGVDGASQLYSLHQLADAYSLSGFDAFLFRFTEMYSRSLLVAQGLVHRPNLPQAYLTGAMARTLALVVPFLEQPKTVELLKRPAPVVTWPNMDTFKDPLALLTLSDQINRRTEQLSAKDPTDVATEDLVCWGIFARSAVLKSKLGREHFGKEYFALMKKFFSLEASTDRLNIFRVKPTNLQNILPCLTALNDLREIDPELLNYKQLFFSIFEERILPAWDNPYSATCRGDGGFFSSLGRDPTDCARQKSSVDNSWLLSVLLNTPWGNQVLNGEF